jgi:hypothetical protein
MITKKSNYNQTNFKFLLKNNQIELNTVALTVTDLFSLLFNIFLFL